MILMLLLNSTTICLICNAQDSELMDINYLENTYCLATVDNEQWYRAYIKNINEESIIVNMFDIGLLTDVLLNQVFVFFKCYLIQIIVLIYL